MWLMTVALNAAVLNGGLAADRARTTTALATTEVMVGETAIGDLVADAIRLAGKGDAALVSAAQFRSGSVGPGKVTAGDITALLVDPDRKWVVCNITGKSLRLAMERSVSRLPDPSAHFLQVAGLRVQYDGQALAGHRVTSSEIREAPVEDGTTYRVIMPEDLAKGGSGYFTVPDFSDKQTEPETTGTLAEAIGQLLEQTPELDYAKPDRVVPLKQGPAEGGG